MPASNRRTIRTRLSLLASSSLAAATVMLSAGGVVLAPTAAMAANECAPAGVDPSVNGPAADTYTCSGAFTATGITYSAAGPLTINSTGAMNVGVTGLNLTGAGSDSVTFTATGVLTGTSGPVIDVNTASGPISLTTAGVTGTNVNVTYGINAVSTAGGAVTVVDSGTVNVTSATVGAQQQAAIRAVSTGGAGAVSVTSGGTVTGRVFGIQAQAGGAGALTITATTTNAIDVNATAGVAAIDATTGTGLLTIDMAGGEGVGTQAPIRVVNGRAGSSIRTNAGADAVINIELNRALQAAGTTAAILDATAVGKTTVNNRGDIGSIGTGTITIVGSPTVLAVRAAGGAFTLNNEHNVWGRFDFTGVTGAATVNNEAAGIWNTSGTSNFGAGAGEVDNDGTINIGSDAAPTATFTGLETFDNTGLIDFRGAGVRTLSMPGATFSGSGSSRLQMEASLGTAGQASCVGAAVADCLDLTGGETSGVTSIIVTPTGAVTTSANTAGIVLVDVSGGVSHAGDFVLDDRSTNYALDPVYGGLIITPGWLGFALQYDAATQQHVLSTVVPTAKLEYIAAPQEILSIWHSTSDTVAGRQADLRDRGDPGAWVRVTGEKTKRDVDMGYTAGGAGYLYQDQYETKAATIVGGLDLFYGELGGGDVVLGLHGGAVKASMERTSSPTTDEIDGSTAGLYAGWWSDGLTLDATVNLNFLTLEHDRPVAKISSTNVISAGVRAEAGWRLPVGPSFYVQPLATVAYVHADIKEVVEEDFAASYEDLDSLRGAVGARIGGDLDMGETRLGYWLTGRVWNEFSGDATLLLATPAEDVAIQDDMGGQFQEIGAGLTLSNSSNTLQGYLSGGARLGDDIDSYTASAGVRLRW